MDGREGLSREGSIPANQGNWMAIRKARKSPNSNARAALLAI